MNELTDFDAIAREMMARDDDAARERGMTLDDYLAERDALSAAEERRARRGDDIARRIRNLAPVEARIPALVHQAIVRGEKLQDTRALREVYKWLRDPSGASFCVLTGIARTGKTVACAWALGRYRDADYVHALDLAERVRPWSADLERGVVPLRLGCELLVVDDLGTEIPSSRMLEATYAVIDTRRGFVRAREGRVRPRTLITSNLVRRGKGDEPSLEKHLDPRVLGRLEEDACWVQADEAPVPVWRRS